jgi:hypothetical protein
MKLIIDGYNLLYKLFKKEPFTLLEEERGYLLQLLNAYKKIKKHKLTIVFDGQHFDKFNSKGVTVIFTENGITADKYIIDYVRENKGVVVITSDNEIINCISNFGVEAIKSEIFASKLEEAFYTDLKGVDEFQEDEYLPGKKLKKKERRKTKVIKKL